MKLWHCISTFARVRVECNENFLYGCVRHTGQEEQFIRILVDTCYNFIHFKLVKMGKIARHSKTFSLFLCYMLKIWWFAHWYDGWLMKLVCQIGSKLSNRGLSCFGILVLKSFVFFLWNVRGRRGCNRRDNLWKTMDFDAIL